MPFKNPNTVFADDPIYTGLKIEQELRTQHPLLEDEDVITKQFINLEIDNLRFIEPYQATSGEDGLQYRQQTATWESEYYIIYFDYYADDHLKINKDMYVYFNWKNMYKNLAFDESGDDIVKLRIVNIPKYARLYSDNSGVDMFECIALRF